MPGRAFTRLAAAITLTALVALTVASAAAELRVVALAVVGDSVTGAALEAAPGGPVLRLTQGETLELRISSDRPLELHLHGYALLTVATPAAAASLTLEARAAGRFPLSSHGAPGSHGHHETLLYLEVLPP